MQRNLVIEPDQLHQHTRDQHHQISSVGLAVVRGQDLDFGTRGAYALALRGLAILVGRVARVRLRGVMVALAVPLVGHRSVRSGH